MDSTIDDKGISLTFIQMINEYAKIDICGYIRYSLEEVYKGCYGDFQSMLWSLLWIIWGYMRDIRDGLWECKGWYEVCNE